MNITLDEVVAWLIVGALAGSLAGMLVKGRKEGFGGIINLGIGLAGSLIGGFLFKLFRINLGLLGGVTITLQEVVAGFIGSLVFLAIVWGVQSRWNAKKAKSDTSGAPKKN
jgi:uncharacterized membrane protein YeaQ/YmgE (transglycosylase-associated protein family)